VDGVNYFHVKVAGLLFVATTRVNVSPSLVLELLQRIARVIKDYLGVLNEDSLRKNFVLVYELLDEVIVSMLSYLFLFLHLLEWLFKKKKFRCGCA
jgi:AP-4 complex subunit mu-1